MGNVLLHQLMLGNDDTGADGRLPRSILDEISQIAHAQVERQYQILNEQLIPALEEKGLRFRRRDDWSEAQANWVKDYFEEEIVPVISPIGLDPSHPFPRLVNKSLNFIVELDGTDAFGREGGMAILPAPRSLPRLIRLPDALCEEGFTDYVFLSSMIHAHAQEVFPGMEVRGCYQFRLTRNADLTVDPEAISDLASALRGELLARRYGDGVRLEVGQRYRPQRLLVRRRQHDRRRDARLQCLLPATHAQAPPVARRQAGEAVRRNGRREVVAARGGEGQKFGRHHGADDVRAVVVGAGLAAAVAVEARHRVAATVLEVAAEDVLRGDELHGRGGEASRQRAVPCAGSARLGVGVNAAAPRR